MSLQERLESFFAVLIEEASRNPEFAARIQQALDLGSEAERNLPFRVNDDRPQGLRKANKRAPAALDPVAVYRKAPDLLKPQLDSLDLDQLRDIVSQYRMDPGGLVRKWKTKERVIDLIIRVAAQRATKGEAFG